MSFSLSTIPENKAPEFFMGNESYTEIQIEQIPEHITEGKLDITVILSQNIRAIFKLFSNITPEVAILKNINGVNIEKKINPRTNEIEKIRHLIANNGEYIALNLEIENGNKALTVIKKNNELTREREWNVENCRIFIKTEMTHILQEPKEGCKKNAA